MSTESLVRTCWKCGSTTSRSERYCQECGSDQWNPAPGKPAIQTVTPQIHYTTHRQVVAGVSIIANIMLFHVFFWLVIVVFAILAPVDSQTVGSLGNRVTIPATLNDYLTTVRVVLAVILSAALTSITWLSLSR